MEFRLVGIVNYYTDFISIIWNILFCRLFSGNHGIKHVQLLSIIADGDFVLIVFFFFLVTHNRFLFGVGDCDSPLFSSIQFCISASNHPTDWGPRGIADGNVFSSIIL